LNLEWSLDLKFLQEAAPNKLRNFKSTTRVPEIFSIGEAGASRPLFYLPTAQDCMKREVTPARKMPPRRTALPLPAPRG